MKKKDPLVERAVSPVIGVVLMVGITLIIAATVQAFAMNLATQNLEEVPNARFDYSVDETTGELRIEHEGGDVIDAENLEIKSSGTINIKDNWSGEVSAGSHTVIELSGVEGEEVIVVWSSGGKSMELSNYEVDG